MSNVLLGESADMYDPVTGRWLGVLDRNGKEVFAPSFLLDSAGNVTGITGPDGGALPAFPASGFRAGDGSAAMPSYSFTLQENTGLYRFAPNDIRASVNGVDSLRLIGSAVIMASQTELAWGSTGVTVVDTKLVRGAANTLAQRNGTAAQSYWLFNTFTDASNYERLNIEWLNNIATFRLDAAGTGISRDVRFLGAAGEWTMDLSNEGAFYPNTPRKLGKASSPIGRLYIDFTNTATVGAVTINKAAGRVNIASGATSIVVTNSMVTAASEVFVVAAQADANNPLIRSVVPAAGSFTITVSTAPAANQAYSFFVVNTD